MFMFILYEVFNLNFIICKFQYKRISYLKTEAEDPGAAYRASIYAMYAFG